MWMRVVVHFEGDLVNRPTNDQNVYHPTIYTEQKKKVSTFVIATISYFEPKSSIQLEYIIRHYCQILTQLKFPKLLKRDSACDRLSKNRKTSC